MVACGWCCAHRLWDLAVRPRRFAERAPILSVAPRALFGFARTPGPGLTPHLVRDEALDAPFPMKPRMRWGTIQLVATGAAAVVESRQTGALAVVWQRRADPRRGWARRGPSRMASAPFCTARARWRFSTKRIMRLYENSSRRQQGFPATGWRLGRCAQAGLWHLASLGDVVRRQSGC